MKAMDSRPASPSSSSLQKYRPSLAATNAGSEETCERRVAGKQARVLPKVMRGASAGGAATEAACSAKVVFHGTRLIGSTNSEAATSTVITNTARASRRLRRQYTSQNPI